MNNATHSLLAIEVRNCPMELPSESTYELQYDVNKCNTVRDAMTTISK